MAGFHIITANMMEILAAKLADVLALPAASPLAADIILINSRGMERWLSMQLAEHHRICANTAFQFPQPFLLNMMSRISDTPETQEYHPDFLAWTIMNDLPVLCQQEELPHIHDYIFSGQKMEEAKLYHLAQRMARIFDRYMVYRPEMLSSWRSGKISHEDEKEQSRIWRHITRNKSTPDPGALLSLFKQKIASYDGGKAIIPERISLIGISSLPPLFLEILHGLSSQADIYLFLLNPCREYWSGVMTHKEMSLTIKQFARGKENIREEELLLDQGNPLLSSLGKTGRDFLMALADTNAHYQDYFVLPGDASLLRVIQSDILNLTNRGKDETPRHSVLPCDRSLEIHVCHSSAREMDVLHDRILTLLDSDESLHPRDILVMTPDIDIYAPLIEAVFGHAGEEHKNGGLPRLPFTIADRKHYYDNPLAQCFFKILDLTGTRFEASSVLSLLDNRVMQDCFGITETDMPKIHIWVKEAGIRWGIHGATDEPCLADPQHTWRRGIDRILLGYALGGEQTRLFMDLVPYGAAEGENAEILGCFLNFLERLFQAADELHKAHTLVQWQEIMTRIVQNFLEVKENDPWFPYCDYLLKTIRCLEDTAFISSFSGTVSLNVIRSCLQERLKAPGFSGSFLSGGITFCAMVPMRSIPFRVIALAGMNHLLFPREASRTSFDLMEHRPRRGDPSVRDNDRYLFLETILSTREKLMIFYTGQNIRDNTPILPSTVVTELMDYVQQGFFLTHEGKEPPGNLHDHLVSKHFLHPFAPSYFMEDSRNRSYRQEYFSAACVMASTPEPPEKRPFVTTPLKTDSPSSDPVFLTDILSFFRHPCRFFVRNSLDIRLEEKENTIPDTELFSLTGLDRYLAGQSLLEMKLDRIPDQDIYQIMTAAGKLPLGEAGRKHYELLRQEGELFVKRLEDHAPQRAGEMAAIDLPLGGRRLVGSLPLWSPHGLFSYRYVDLKGKDFLPAWVQHLVLQTSFPEKAWGNYLVGRDAWYHWSPAEESATLLTR
ncbi:MAG: exodeoxyribonuclease V subunit gamma, partial [Syntrophobacterales bacterium]|nr:exodeoxyribonuclease V subunit gamma [Syntrophobacterales bacterium]